MLDDNDADGQRRVDEGGQERERPDESDPAAASLENIVPARVYRRGSEHQGEGETGHGRPRMYAGAPRAVNRSKKSGPKPASKLLRSLLSVRLYRSVDDTHAVAAVPGRRRGLRERASGAVVVAHDDLVFLFLLHRFLD